MDDVICNIDEGASQNRADNLNANDACDLAHGGLRRKEHGQHLVGGRKDYRDEGAKRNNAASIERCCGGRKATLGNRTKQRANNRTC